jgi:hypothetical protein
MKKHVGETMKKKMKYVKKILVATSSVLLLAVLFAACKKNLDVENNNPVAALMAFNLVADKPALGISLGGSSITSAPLSYSNYTGSYLTIYPGNREIVAYDYNSPAPLATTTANFELNKYYSLFVVGAGGTYKNVVVNDNLDSLSATSGEAYVRYINAIPDSSRPLVTISAAGSNLVNKNEDFATVSEFKGINPGEITVKISNGSTISATRTINLEKGKVYTILLAGIPGQTDAEKQVQIKYITNGTVE